MTLFAGSIPEFYHRYLGPLLSAGYATDLAGRLRSLPANDGCVLEVAAGTGVLTERLRSRLPPEVRLTATDLNAPMLDLAKRRIAGPMAAGITWRVADAGSLPFNDECFDAVVCQFGVMFFPDKGQAARETYRVLRPSGQWLFNVWGSWAENSFGPIVHEAIASFFPDDPPQFNRVPFGFHDPVALRDLVLGAGFPEPEITELTRMAEAPSAAEAAIGFVRGNPSITAIEERGTANPEAIIRKVAESLARAFGDYPLRVPTCIRVVSAHRPRFESKNRSASGSQG
ncbi:MAG TPA: class I SAM-dependent methyltransferase [Gemmatimonadales bacterium]|nr:class I SAM-dependent methyltransferase [Gemmatimonadales bacterium]